MRSLALGLIFVACGGAPSAICPRAPVVVVPTPPPGAEPRTLLYADRKFVAVARIEDAIDSGLAKRIFDATFPKYLSKECPDMPPVCHARSWVELDELKAKATRAGLMQPRVLQRVDGHFTARDVDETLVTIEPGNCVGNGAQDMIYVVLAASNLSVRARIDESGFGGTWRIVGVVERDGLDVLISAPSMDVTWKGYALAANARAISLGVRRLAADAFTGWTWAEEPGGSFLGPSCRVSLTAPPAPLALRTFGCEK